MSIILDEGTIGIWFVQLTDESDWLLHLGEKEDVFEITYRFRYYVDDKIHDSNDKKNWYRAEVKKDNYTFKQALEHAQTAYKLLYTMAGNAPHHELLKGKDNMEEFTNRFASLPFAHAEKHTQH